MTQPLLVTLGDPAGIGPEIVVRSHLAGEMQDAVVVGSPDVLRRGFEACGLPDAPIAAWPTVWPLEEAGSCITDAAGRTGHDAPAAREGPAWASLPWGQVDARCGEYAARSVASAVAHLRQGRGRALVTAPLHKEALGQAGIDFPGHTEMLQAWCAQEPPEVRMMLANDELRVVLVTIHTSLRQAVDAVKTAAVLQTIRITHEALRRWGLPKPRIAVAGLNPHAGEGGRFGREEIEEIAPAIALARDSGIDAQGPFAPDTVFMRARHTPERPGAFDAVVAMTHDHGLIPVKYLGVEQGVNITLGLPFVRTSPDHGTAFDIAGQGVADPSSFIQALRMARRLTPYPVG